MTDPIFTKKQIYHTPENQELIKNVKEHHNNLGKEMVKMFGFEEEPTIPRSWAWLTILLLVLTIFIAFFTLRYLTRPPEFQPVETKHEELRQNWPPSSVNPCYSPDVYCGDERAPTGQNGSHTALITAFSRVEGCDDPACIMASGRTVYVGAAACPRRIPLGAKLYIEDKIYTCEDRTAKKFDGRYDIYVESYEEARQFGVQKLEVKIL